MQGIPAWRARSDVIPFADAAPMLAPGARQAIAMDGTSVYVAQYGNTDGSNIQIAK
jgi:hypothetical protein